MPSTGVVTRRVHEDAHPPQPSRPPWPEGARRSWPGGDRPPAFETGPELPPAATFLHPSHTPPPRACHTAMARAQAFNPLHLPGQGKPIMLRLERLFDLARGSPPKLGSLWLLCRFSVKEPGRPLHEPAPGPRLPRRPEHRARPADVAANRGPGTTPGHLPQPVRHWHDVRSPLIRPSIPGGCSPRHRTHAPHQRRPYRRRAWGSRAKQNPPGRSHKAELPTAHVGKGSLHETQDASTL